MQKTGDRMATVMEELRARSQVFSETTVATEAPYYNCHKCKDTGSYFVRKKNGYFIRGIEVEQDYYVECECAKMRKINRLIKSSAITEKFRAKGFGNFDTDGRSAVVCKMKEKALQYYTAFDDIRETVQNSVLFIGQPGCGKTHLLIAIANNLMAKKVVPVAYFPYQDGMNEISANDFEKKNDIIHRMKEVDVLFIDDLFKPIGGVVKVHKWQADIIAEVVNHRYLNLKPMLISSELYLDDMLSVDEALASRIFEMAEDFTVTIERNVKANYRLRKVLDGR